MAVDMIPCRRRDLVLLSLVAFSLFLWFQFAYFGPSTTSRIEISRVEPTRAQLLGEDYADDEPPANATLGVSISISKDESAADHKTLVWQNNCSDN
jgi:hypothetical protein